MNNSYLWEIFIWVTPSSHVSDIAGQTPLPAACDKLIIITGFNLSFSHDSSTPSPVQLLWNMEPCLPIPIPQEKLDDLVEKAKDYCLMHGGKYLRLKWENLIISPGICMRQKSKFDRDALHFAPFVLLPSPFPKDEYYKAVKLQTVLNELMHKARTR